MKVFLNESEVLAINEFLSEHWSGFLATAENYLSKDEIADLEEKLEN